MMPHERLLSPHRPAPAEDLENALHAAVAAGELEEGTGRRLLDLVDSMRGTTARRTTSTTEIGRNGR